MIPTVNFHLTEACNFGCKFCYATFEDIERISLKKNLLSKDYQKKIITLLAEYGKFKKINFAGGEPTLIRYIGELIQHAKECGLTTSIVTNASLIDEKWVKSMAPYLDIFAVSIDSLFDETNRKIGRVPKRTNGEVERTQKGAAPSQDKFIRIADACRENGVYLKVNTVVCRYNYQEKMTDFINTLQPFHWKVLQVTRIEGQNDLNFEEMRISHEEFQEFCNQNQVGLDKEIKFIKETEELIRGSYLMVDPLGRFYASTKGCHSYSSPILEVGVERALKEIEVDVNKFIRRGGDYSLDGRKKDTVQGQ